MKPTYAAPRDASSIPRPNTRTPKKVHIAHESFPPHPALFALCSNATLDTNTLLNPADVPTHARCRRPACNKHWP